MEPGQRERLLAELGCRRMLAEPGTGGKKTDGEVLTLWGQPAWRAVPRGEDAGAPQALMDAGPRQKLLVQIAYADPACGDDACAAWVEDAWAGLGLGAVSGCARELYERFCAASDLALLKVGMIVAVPEVPYTFAGREHGHVGLYVGDGAVMDCAEGRVRKAPLDLWLSTYGVMAEPRWGWLAHVGLD